jgi:hypothetical protein
MNEKQLFEKVETPNNKVKKSLSQEYRRILVDWISNTKAHGVPNIQRTQYWFIRIFWFVCFIACFSYFIITLVKIAKKFKEHGVLTSITVVNEVNVEFPAVDFCNVNPFKYSINSNSDYNVTEAENFNRSIDYFESYKSLALDYLYIGDILVKAGSLYYFRFEEMVISCVFDGIECTKDDFYAYRDYQYGICYRFNSGRIKSLISSYNDGQSFHNTYLEGDIPKRSVTEAGVKSGLRMEIFTGDPNGTYYTEKNGIHLIIHNASVYVSPSDDGINIPTGHAVNVGIARTITNKLSAPYSDCISDIIGNKKDKISNSETAKFIGQMINVYNFTTYNQNFCLKLCKQDFILNNCGCYDSQLPLPENQLEEAYKQFESSYNGRPLQFLNDSRTTTTCTVFDLKDPKYLCLQEQRDAYKITNSEICLSYCPSSCTSITYDLEISSSDYPSDK